jgi:uncharacterized protein with HEPN domain
MSLPDEDLVRLRHMRDAAQQAVQFCVGRARSDLDSDVMLRFALVHAVTVLGEAASRVSVDTRAALPALAWPAIVGMRNRLVHAYFDIDTAMLWDTLAHSVPDLLQQLQLIEGVGPPGSATGSVG